MTCWRCVRQLHRATNQQVVQQRDLIDKRFGDVQSRINERGDRDGVTLPGRCHEVPVARHGLDTP
jgi:hypothetical protein